MPLISGSHPGSIEMTRTLSLLVAPSQGSMSVSSTSLRLRVRETNVPLPWLRTRYPMFTSSRSARTMVMELTP